MTVLRIAAPAKLNLHLEVLGRRADGFHALESIFQTIALHDDVELRLHPAPGITLSCDDASLPADGGNLAWRAAAAFLARAPATGVAIALAKRIPHGAGLGGGSSDAAAVLRGLARLLPGFWSAAELATLAAALGSDVPFFLVGGTAHGTGRGEILSALPDLPAQPVTVLMPAASLATPAVFKAMDDAERGPRVLRGAPWWQAALARDGVVPHLHNRLAPAAQRLCPEVGALLAWLAGQGVPHLMSGSGAACFALAHLAPPSGVRAWHTTFRPRAELDAVG